MTTGVSTIPFIGRQMEMDSFRWFFDWSKNVKYYSGPAGMGKSRLKEQLAIYASGRQLATISTYLDFSQSKFAHVNIGIWILRWLRRELGQQGIKFHLFDLAYLHYVREVEMLAGDNYQQEVNKWGLVDSLMGVFKDGVDTSHQWPQLYALLVTGGVAVTQAGLGGTLLPGLVGLSFFAQLINVVQELRGYFGQLISDKELAQLDEFKSLDIANDRVMLGQLAELFAADVNRHCLANGNQRIVIFVDAYDHFRPFINPVLDTDEKSDVLGRLVNGLQTASWTIFGRESRINLGGQWRGGWRLGPLDDKSVGEFFAHYISDWRLKTYLVNECGGLPWLIVRWTHQLQRLLAIKQLAISDFVLSYDDHQAIVESFLSPLADYERNTLALLAVPIKFKTQTIDELRPRFNLSYLVRNTQVEKHFPFTEFYNGGYHMPKRLRKSLLITNGPELNTEVEQFLREQGYQDYWFK